MSKLSQHCQAKGSRLHSGDTRVKAYAHFIYMKASRQLAQLLGSLSSVAILSNSVLSWLYV